MSLTQKQIQEYIDNEGLHCPYCESDHGVDEQSDGHVVCMNPDCAKEWDNDIQIIGICEND